MLQALQLVVVVRTAMARLASVKTWASLPVSLRTSCECRHSGAFWRSWLLRRWAWKLGPRWVMMCSLTEGGQLLPTWGLEWEEEGVTLRLQRVLT